MTINVFCIFLINNGLTICHNDANKTCEGTETNHLLQHILSSDDTTYLCDILTQTTSMWYLHNVTNSQFTQTAFSLLIYSNFKLLFCERKCVFNFKNLFYNIYGFNMIK